MQRRVPHGFLSASLLVHASGNLTSCHKAEDVNRCGLLIRVSGELSEPGAHLPDGLLVIGTPL